MRKLLAIFLMLCLLSGCNRTQDVLEPVLTLRQQLLQGECSFSAVVTADFGDKTYSFSMDCVADSQGNLTFTVTAPETITGISGKIEKGEGALVFDDAALAFDLLTDDRLSPISGPWILLKTLRSGYIRSAGEAGEYCRISLMDSYAEDALAVDVWLTTDHIPVQAEIFWEERRILTIEVKNFIIA